MQTPETGEANRDFVLSPRRLQSIYQRKEEAILMGLHQRLGRDSTISQMSSDLLRLILRQEHEVAPCISLQASRNEAEHLDQNSSLAGALEHWREQSVRMLIRLQRGQYFLSSRLEVRGTVCLESIDDHSARHILIHGPGEQKLASMYRKYVDVRACVCASVRACIRVRVCVRALARKYASFLSLVRKFKNRRRRLRSPSVHGRQHCY